jgi:RND family efflux transporter MFP subunit
MKRRGRAGAAVLVLFAAAMGCSAEGKDPKGAGRTGKPVVAVEAARAAVGEMTSGIDVVGALSPKFQAEVKSEVSGSVAEVFVAEWVRVKKGDPLARVDTREAEALLRKAEAAVGAAKAGLLEARAAGNRADRELERALKLAEAGLLTRQGEDDARTQKEAAAARVAAAESQVLAAEEDVHCARTRVSKAVIRSPFDGTVAERLVNVGEVVGEMQKVVFRLVDNRLLDLTVSVPSVEMAGLRIGNPLVFSADAFPGRSFAGTVKFINPAVSDADRSVKVIAEVRNVPEVLKGGLFVKGRIVTGRRTGVLQIPRSSLVAWDVGEKTAFVLVVADNVARRRAVRTGSVAEDRVEVSSGIAPDDMVVTRGGFNVGDGDRVKVVRPGGN